MFDSIWNFFLGLFVSSPGDPLMFYIELMGFLTGIISVYLIAKEKIAGWPIGVLNVIIYVFVFYKYGFVSDTILFAIFLPMQIYGWIYWMRGGREKERLDDFVVNRLTSQQLMEWYITGVFVTFLWGYAMWIGGKAGFFPEPALPYHDAATTVFSLIAQYLMARRFIECWIIWITVDILAPMNYLEKGLVPTAILFLVYLGLATMGFWEWKRTLDKQEVEPCVA